VLVLVLVHGGGCFGRSAGCVVAECVLASPVFAGSTMIEQLGEIMKVLGTPTQEEILLMNKNYDGFKVRACAACARVLECFF
jgi:hypothetical protein